MQFIFLIGLYYIIYFILYYNIKFDITIVINSLALLFPMDNYDGGNNISVGWSGSVESFKIEVKRPLTSDVPPFIYLLRDPQNKWEFMFAILLTRKCFSVPNLVLWQSNRTSQQLFKYSTLAAVYTFNDRVRFALTKQYCKYYHYKINCLFDNNYLIYCPYRRCVLVARSLNLLIGDEIISTIIKESSFLNF